LGVSTSPICGLRGLGVDQTPQGKKGPSLKASPELRSSLLPPISAFGTTLIPTKAWARKFGRRYDRSVYDRTVPRPPLRATLIVSRRRWRHVLTIHWPLTTGH
jgi:hypothetical protein